MSVRQPDLQSETVSKLISKASTPVLPSPLDNTVLGYHLVVLTHCGSAWGAGVLFSVNIYTL